MPTYLLAGGTTSLVKTVATAPGDALVLVRSNATVLTKFHLAHKSSGEGLRGQLWPRGSDYFSTPEA